MFCLTILTLTLEICALVVHPLLATLVGQDGPPLQFSNILIQQSAQKGNKGISFDLAYDDS